MVLWCCGVVGVVVLWCCGVVVVVVVFEAGFHNVYIHNVTLAPQLLATSH